MHLRGGLTVSDDMLRGRITDDESIELMRRRTGWPNPTVLSTPARLQGRMA
jgi:hypothetical protein